MRQLLLLLLIGDNGHFVVDRLFHGQPCSEVIFAVRWSLLTALSNKYGVPNAFSELINRREIMYRGRPKKEPGPKPLCLFTHELYFEQPTVRQ